MATLQLVTLIIWVWLTDTNYIVHTYNMDNPDECQYRAQAIAHELAARPDILGHLVECQVKEIERHEATGG